MRAHDGAPLTALVARSAFAEVGQEVHLRSEPDLSCVELDHPLVECGGTDLVFRYPNARRLEDRVLDLVRILDAACSLEGIECKDVVLCPSGACIQDEFAIVQFLRQEGWIQRLMGHKPH